VRSNPPFFRDRATIELIDHVAQTKELCIFAGAGVTITRTGLDWRGMIQALVPAELRSLVVAQHLGELFTDSQSATVLVEMYKSLAVDDEMAGRLLRAELRRLLYRNGQWLAGPLTERIANLVTVRDLSGQYSSILTTNFDTYIERSIAARKLLLDASAVQLRRWTRTALPTDALAVHGNRQLALHNQSAGVDMVYLHGFLDDLDEGEVATSLDGTSTEGRSTFNNELEPNELDPVLAEDNFARSAVDTERMLTSALAKMPALFLGTSLTDQPVLRSLLSSLGGADGKEGIRPRHSRWAIMPLQPLAGRLKREEDQNEYVRLQRLRLRHFGVEGVFPDFYIQVSQFVEEVTLATHLQSGAYSAPGYEGTYSRRLSAWWHAWLLSRRTSQEFVDAQSRDHDRLVQTLERVRDSLRFGQADEQFKLEVWIRWAPSSLSRALRLWASSAGTLAGAHVMRSGAIDGLSKYAAIQTFCSGRPLLLPNDNAGSRWKTYLAQPIYQTIEIAGLTPAVGRAHFPVGVIALGSDSDRPESALKNWNQGGHAAALQLMHNVGEEITNALPEST